MQVIFLRENGTCILLVFINSPLQIVGDSGIEGRVVLVGHDVNAIFARVHELIVNHRVSKRLRLLRPAEAGLAMTK